MAKKKAKPKRKPKKKLIVPIEGGQQCTARVKICRNDGCGYKFNAGDKSWVCPECGTYRRCKSKTVHPYSVCRMHGAGGGRPPTSGKFIPPQQIVEAYNALYDDPLLLSLAFNIALSEARTQELLNMIDDMDIRAQAGDIASGINELLGAVYDSANVIDHFKNEYDKQLKSKDGKIDPKIDDMNFKTVEWFIATANRIKEELTPEIQAQKVWRQVNAQLEITRRLNDTERKWIDQHDQMIPMSTVLEALAIVIRMALIFIPNSQDRSAFAKKMRALMPGVRRG